MMPEPLEPYRSAIESWLKTGNPVFSDLTLETAVRQNVISHHTRFDLKWGYALPGLVNAIVRDRTLRKHDWEQRLEHAMTTVFDNTLDSYIIELEDRESSLRSRQSHERLAFERLIETHDLKNMHQSWLKGLRILPEAYHASYARCALTACLHHMENVFQGGAYVPLNEMLGPVQEFAKLAYHDDIPAPVLEAWSTICRFMAKDNMFSKIELLNAVNNNPPHTEWNRTFVMSFDAIQWINAEEKTKKRIQALLPTDQYQTLALLPHWKPQFADDSTIADALKEFLPEVHQALSRCGILDDDDWRNFGLLQELGASLNPNQPKTPFVLSLPTCEIIP